MFIGESMFLQYSKHCRPCPLHEQRFDLHPSYNRLYANKAFNIKSKPMRKKGSPGNEDEVMFSIEMMQLKYAKHQHTRYVCSRICSYYFTAVDIQTISLPHPNFDWLNFKMNLQIFSLSSKNNGST